jgi:hypothetical protein
MSEQSESIISAEIEPGEVLIWSGKPQRGILFRSIDILMVPFSVFWCVFAIIWEYTAISSALKQGAGPTAFILPLLGIPFVLLALYFVFGRFIMDARRREKTRYGVTDRRVIIVSGLFGKRVKSLNLGTLTDVSLSERPDGKGTISFGQKKPLTWLYGGGIYPVMGYLPKFERVDNAGDVYKLIKEAREKS